MTDKLKIGILDLLTILLPGAYFLLMIWYYNDQIGLLFNNMELFFNYEWIGAVLLIGTAYVLGHFVFFIASFLDDLIYEKVKRVYWHDHNKLVAYVLKLKEKRTGVSDRNVLSAFSWSNAYLIAKEPTTYAEVERYMAESKFFRSLVVVLLTTLVIYLIKGEKVDHSVVLIVSILIFLSLLRYLTQRQKSIQTAYHGMITTSGEIFAETPDQHYLTILEKGNILPFKGIYIKIKEKDKKLKEENEVLEAKGMPKNTECRFDRFGYSIIKFLYTIGLCIIPCFERLISKRQSLK